MRRETSFQINVLRQMRMHVQTPVRMHVQRMLEARGVDAGAAIDMQKSSMHIYIYIYTYIKKTNIEDYIICPKVLIVFLSVRLELR